MVLLVVAAGCARPVAVRRAAMVPLLSSPWGAVGETAGTSLGVGAKGLPEAVDTQAPGNTGSSAGLYVPRLQFDADVSTKVAERVRIGGRVEASSASWASPARNDLPELLPSAMLLGLTTGASFHQPIDRGGVVVSGTLSLHFLPFSTEELSGGRGTYHAGTAALVGASGALLPYYRVGPVTMFGGFQMASHGVNQRGAVTTHTNDSSVSAGATYAAVGLGARLGTPSGFSVVAQCWVPLSTQPVQYPAIASLAVAYGFGEAAPAAGAPEAPVEAPAGAVPSPAEAPPSSAPAPPVETPSDVPPAL